jgi:ElaB/YqjD/DUF883 family membrane-anchored ribosome-binding protein
MTERDITVLLGKIAIMVEQFGRDCDRAQQDLRLCTQQAPQMLSQSLQEQLHGITDQATAGVRQGLARPLDECEQRLRQAGDRAREATQVLADQAQHIESLHRHLLWKVAGVVLGALVLVVGGAIWLSMYYAGVIRDNQISAELLKAYNQADVTLCEGRLCAKIGKKYLPVEPR